MLGFYNPTVNIARYIKTFARHFYQRRFLGISITVFLSCSLLLFVPKSTQASTLSIGPSNGTFSVGSTFDVSIFLDTQKESINALGIYMSFPADKLQLVSPATGKSIISVWTAPPEFNNQTGRISLQGGIPNGINVSSGLVVTLTFRVKAVGTSVVRFLDGTRVLLNDGLGSDSLKNTTNGIYQLTLPPPAGPIVTSPTHPNQSVWYNNPDPVLEWALDDRAQAYSYILNKEPVDVIDNIAEGSKTSVVYKGLADGIYYFHIKALREGAWGGTTHFAIQIDTAPPAEFGINIIPSARTTRKQPVVEFSSSDSASGIDHYELKLVPLTPSNGKSSENQQQFFIETDSPYVTPPLDFGNYDVIVRAYDKAGNSRETTKHLAIVHTVFEFISGKGIEIRNAILIPWSGFWIAVLLLILLLVIAAWRMRKWHHEVAAKRAKKELPDSVQKQLQELQRYRSRYGSKALLLLVVLGISLALSHPVLAQGVGLTPPLINTFSRSISNEEIFYVGGKTKESKTDVILYVQSLQTGETTSQTITSDDNGDWFYRGDRFLTTGDYLLWAQGKSGDELSPPSPQVKISVRATALQFGESRLSYEMLYFILLLVLVPIIIGLILYTIFHAYHGRKKHLRFVQEVREAEESVRRGFAVLRKDIQAEFSVIKRAKLSKELSDAERIQEEQLLKDLQMVERYIGKEIWDVQEEEGFN